MDAVYRRKMQRRRFWSTWHRRFGLIISIVVIAWVITGISLNHTDSMDLARNYVSNTWILDMYAIKQPERIIHYKKGDDWFSEIDQQLFFNQTRLDILSGKLKGVVADQAGYVLLIGNTLVWLTQQGKVIEKFTKLDGVPEKLQSIGQSASGEIWIKNGVDLFLSSHEDAVWSKREFSDEIRWSQPMTGPEELHQKVIEQYRGRVLTLEQLLLDIHSGRVIGMSGVLLMDLISVMLLFLAFTGIWLWWARRS